MTSSGPSRATILRCAAAAAALVAALGPSGAPGRGPTLRVLLSDVSWSTARAAPDAAELSVLAEGLAASDRAAVVAFAEGARVAAAPSAAGQLAVSGAMPGRSESSLAAALRAADALRPAGGSLELLLATDAAITDDAAALASAAATVAAHGGATLRVLPFAAPGERSVVTDLRGPGRVAAGEVVSLEAAGVAGPGGATLELIGAGEVLETRRIDAAGPFRAAFIRSAGSPGLVSWECRARETPDVPAAVARVVVAAPGAVAVMGRDAGRAEAIRRALGGPAAFVGPRAAGAVLAGHDAVLVDGIPADPAALETLRAFAAAGGGVVLLDAFETLAPAAEGLSPLRARPPEGPGGVVYLALDGSGSMAEPWPGTDRGPARDVAVRAAAAMLLRDVRPGSTVVLRRFRGSLVPDGAPPARMPLDPSGAGLDRALEAVRALPAPGGSTAFLPVLAEALDEIAAASDGPRAVVLLTDGRSSEDATALRASLRKLTQAQAHVAVVVPAKLAGDDDAPFLAACRAEGVALYETAEPEALGRVLARAARRAQEGDRTLSERALSATAQASPALPAPDVPSVARRMFRNWAAPDATVLVRTADGDPYVAVRRCGTGAVAAIAAPLPDAAWTSGDGGEALVRSVVRAVMRRASARVRVARDGDRLLVRVDLPPGALPPVSLRCGALAPALREVGDGLYAADLPPGAGSVAEVALLDGQGSELATLGLDAPLPAEYRDGPRADLDALAAALAPPQRPAGRPLRPYLAALCVVLLVASSIKWGPRRTR